MEEISILGIVGFPAIVVLCLLAGMVAKNIESLNDKWIPCICGICGGLLGALGMSIIPDFPAHDYISAIAVGVVSGLGATGAHQVVKQLSKKGE